MMRRFSFFVACAALSATLTATDVAAGIKTAVDRLSREVPMSATGTFRVFNPNGNVTIVGSSQAAVTFVAERVVRGMDEDDVADARHNSELRILADGTNAVLQSLVPANNPNEAWSVAINYTIHVPRGAQIQLFTGTATRIDIRDVSGSVLVRNTSGTISVVGVTGPTTIETGNGTIVAQLAEKHSNTLRASSINGRIQIAVPPGASFSWTAEALRGELFSNVDLRGDFDSSRPGKYYRGVAGPKPAGQVETFTVTGSIYLLRRGTATAQAAALRPRAPSPSAAPAESISAEVVRMLMQPPSARSYVFQRSELSGDITFDTSLGNIFIGAVHGDAQLMTRAGEIVLGEVSGNCSVRSYGGPLNLGTVGGTLTARTEAGDVSVRSAQRGGYAGTSGGNITIGYAGGPITTVSGGGDITIRRTSAAVNATSRSGDITLTLDPAVRTQRVNAKVVGGNILLNVGPGFAADVDALIVTSNPEVRTIMSELPGLTITTEQAGGRSRIHAVGKLNGGGQRLDLRAEEGNIQIRTRTAPSTN